MLIRKTLILLISLVLLSQLVPAQQTTGSLTGATYDVSGNPVEDVVVYIERYPDIEDITDALGRYRLDDVPIGEQVIIFFHDEYQSSSTTVNVIGNDTISVDGEHLAKKAGFSLWLILVPLTVIIVLVLVIFLTRRRKDAPVIDEIFLICKDGRLIKHFTRRLKPDMDEDILSSMLVAVQDFIKDSFRGEEGALDEMKFGKFQIIIGRGQNVIIAALVLGEDVKPFKPQVEKCLFDIEDRYGDLLVDWDGDVDKLSGCHEHITNLIDGKYE